MIVFPPRVPGERAGTGSPPLTAGLEARHGAGGPQPKAGAALGAVANTRMSLPLSPADAAARACLAAQIAVREELLARIVPLIRALGSRYPQFSLPRLSRLVLEQELRHPSVAPAGVVALLSLDAFGDAAVSPPSAGAPPEQTASTLLNPDNLASTQRQADAFFDELAQARPGGLAWQWFSLGASDWSSGGSLRVSIGQVRRLVNLDINTQEGQWQFHWSEPRRRRLYFRCPPVNGAATSWPNCLRLLESLTGTLGFGDFVEMDPKDWYDGFNYVSFKNIISGVDILT